MGEHRRKGITLYGAVKVIKWSVKFESGCRLRQLPIFAINTSTYSPPSLDRYTAAGERNDRRNELLSLGPWGL